MKRIIVDSGSSIKQHEKEKYNCEILPLKILLGEKEYLDGIDLTFEEFYDSLINKKIFPKTSLPPLTELEEKVNTYTNNGDEVIIVTISSKISGTFNTIRLLFEDNPNVLMIDSCCAVGGIKLIVDEINRNINEPLNVIEEKVKNLIPRITIMAIPETLNYLLMGGRLSKTEWLFGSLLHIKPIIGFENGKVHVVGKKHGLKPGMKYIAEALNSLECDPNYDIVPSYTYNDDNLKTLIKYVDEKYHKQFKDFDNLDPAIACHWGPNAFGLIFVKK